MRIPDPLITSLFDQLASNVNLLKFSMANTSLLGCPAMEQLCHFLAYNDILTEANFSFCQLTIEQLTEIFEALKGTLNLAHLNVSYNFNEYTRYPAQAELLFTTMAEYFDSHTKLVHLDLSGLNL